MSDFRVHSRLLIAVPVLILGEVLMESRFRAVWLHLRRAHLLQPDDIKYMDGVMTTVRRLRDSLLPECLIVVLLLFHTLTAYRGLIDASPWLAKGVGTDLHLTAAGWYAILVSTSIFQFLLGLAVWKWLLWTFFAFKLSTRDLKLVPTHPDEHGGLGFLGLTAAAFAPVTFALSAVIGATWRQDILYKGANLMNFKLAAIAWIVIVAVVALGPLVFFVPRLAALRRKGILEYGILGQMHSSDYHEKWILHRGGHEDEFLKAPESMALAAFGNSYEKIEQLKPFPLDKVSLYFLCAAILIPALPAILAQIPVAVVIQDLLKAVR
jgi:hypothetical protein